MRLRGGYVFRLLALASLATALAAGCTRTRRPVEGEKVLTHRVEHDESLEEIARDYYGDPDRAKEIARFNEIESDEVAAGDVLRVPMTPEEMEGLHRREQARAPYNDGLRLAERGSYVDAISRFKRAVELDPGFHEAWFNMALTHQRIGALDPAVEEYREAVDLKPRNAEYRYALGGAYYHQERYGKAIKSFENAIEIDPFHRKARFSLALALEKKGDVVRAREEWQRYLELDATSEWADQARAHLESLK